MRDFQAIQTTAYDIVIIGGGINGAGTARDAALRGLKPLLIEKNDFAGGTTSWSTRLVHGGLRYLEYFEFHLVRESLREREILLQAAPHLVKPIQMTIPIYRDGSRRYWEIQAGMLLYDILSFDKTLLSHRMLSATKFQQHFRTASSDQLTGAAQYYDGQAEYAERLCLENIRSAAAAGATVLNYVAVTAIPCKGDRISALTCEDQLTGATFDVPIGPKTVVVNTSGPWVDQVCQLGRQGDRPRPMTKARKIGGTKGSHIVVDAFPGAPDTAFYVEARTDGRPFFIVPWLGMYLIGTTDLRYEGNLDRVKADNDEIDYLLNETNRIFPVADLSRDHVKFTYSGVRPLPYKESSKAGSITRDHILFDHQVDGIQNLISLIGGKLTTYRQVGEEMVDKACRKLQRSIPPSPARTVPLPGAIRPQDSRIGEAIAHYEAYVSRESIHHLFKVYGALATEVLALIDDAPDLAERLIPELPDIRAQAVYSVQAEYAHTLVDICRRRTTLAMRHNYGFDVLPAIVETLMTHCGWDDDRCNQQLADYATYMTDNCIPDYAIAASDQAQFLPSLSMADRS
ncbi:MAG: glycerol-3-phosphate dehydrogenase [Synechococcales cyanobacterium K44_A2020_017]|nr:glycerol-3-phosphate dehydrogenase [Synechococcales cyanobacterium K32_A2020_035]MBF2094963.1 glycerol-3-phosphate dehydrogenase [Synechococcales cyanobacterium K44_A2020_017]